MFENKIKEYRVKRGLSQAQLAEKIGLKKSTISMYEAGRREPKFEVLEAIADVLNVGFLDLFGRGEESFLYGLGTPQLKKVPRLGVIKCGEPIRAEENFDGFDDVPDGIHCDFTLICEGDSMMNAQIMDGDIVYIRKQEAVENGDIAAVWIDGETTLKRFYRQSDTVTLMPENPQYAPIVCTGDKLRDLRIIGKAVGFTRIFQSRFR